MPLQADDVRLFLRTECRGNDAADVDAVMTVFIDVADATISAAYSRAQSLKTFWRIDWEGQVHLCQVWRLLESIGLGGLTGCAQLSSKFIFDVKEGRQAALAPISLREFALGFMRIARLRGLLTGESRFPILLKKLCSEVNAGLCVSALTPDPIAAETYAHFRGEYAAATQETLLQMVAPDGTLSSEVVACYFRRAAALRPASAMRPPLYEPSEAPSINNSSILDAVESEDA